MFGTLQELEKELFNMAIANINIVEYQDAKVVVKGCSGNAIPTSAYVEVVRILQPVTASLMFGEPCSTVPVYKKPKQNS